MLDFVIELMGGIIDELFLKPWTNKMSKEMEKQEKA